MNGCLENIFFMYYHIPYSQFLKYVLCIFVVDIFAIYKLHLFIILSQLLGEMLWDRNNNAVMNQYVSSVDNLRILMNLLKVWNSLVSTFDGILYQNLTFPSNHISNWFLSLTLILIFRCFLCITFKGVFWKKETFKLQDNDMDRKY